MLSNKDMSVPLSVDQFSSVQSLSHVRLFVTPWSAALQAFLSITNSWSLLKLMSIKRVMPSNHLILCYPLLLPPSIFPSIRVFSSESVLCIRWLKIGALASASVLPMNIQGWFPLGWTGWISLHSNGLSRVLSNTTVQKYQFFSPQLSLWSNSHIYMTTVKTIAVTRRIFVGKVTYLPFNMLSRFVIAFLPRSKCLLISCLQSPSAVILKPKKIKSVTVSIVSPSICHEVMGLDTMILLIWMLSFKPTFSLSFFTFIKRLFSSSSISAIRLMSSAYLRLSIFLPAILIPACVSSSLAFGMIYPTHLSFYSLPFTSFLFSAICKASSDNHFAFLHFFSWGWSSSLPPVQCHKPLTIVLQALCLSDLIPWIYLSLPLYNYKGFDLGHTWMV